MGPIAAVQIEYNPWTLDIEGDVGTHLLETCRELGVAIVTFSPLGRGFLTGRFAVPPLRRRSSKPDTFTDDFFVPGTNRWMTLKRMMPVGCSRVSSQRISPRILSS